ncbi:MAG: acyl-CoA thioester hydrolase [Planctomycetota bacterium]|nr:MAG: acyl-CoA thioester hydrolase [Planctomycetota bacterium]
MSHVVESTFTVRSYEGDSYGHLNNGVYLGWFEQGRLDWLLSKSFSYDGFAQREEWFVVGRTEVDFRQPLLVGESVVLHSEIETLGRSSVTFRQRMLRNGDTLVCEAKTIMVFAAHGASIAIPDDFRAAAEG